MLLLLLSALGAAYGTAKSGTGIAAMSVMRPELIMKSIIPVVMAGIIAIYGLVVAVLIGNGCKLVEVWSVLVKYPFHRVEASFSQFPVLYCTALLCLASKHILSCTGAALLYINECRVVVVLMKQRTNLFSMKKGLIIAAIFSNSGRLKGNPEAYCACQQFHCIGWRMADICTGFAI